MIYKDIKLANIYNSKTIYIIHYPKGDKFIQPIDIIKNISIDNIKIDHCGETSNGSSGPILNLDTYKALRLHLVKEKDNNFNDGTVLKHPDYRIQKK